MDGPDKQQGLLPSLLRTLDTLHLRRLHLFNHVVRFSLSMCQLEFVFASLSNQHQYQQPLQQQLLFVADPVYSFKATIVGPLISISFTAIIVHVVIIAIGVRGSLAVEC